jgi:hypothetical protein
MHPVVLSPANRHYRVMTSDQLAVVKKMAAFLRSYPGLYEQVHRSRACQELTAIAESRTDAAMFKDLNGFNEYWPPGIQTSLLESLNRVLGVKYWQAGNTRQLTQLCSRLHHFNSTVQAHR